VALRCAESQRFASSCGLAAAWAMISTIETRSTARCVIISLRRLPLGAEPSSERSRSVHLVQADRCHGDLGANRERTPLGMPAT
jgi:hypothetical protein